MFRKAEALAKIEVTVEPEEKLELCDDLNYEQSSDSEPIVEEISTTLTLDPIQQTATSSKLEPKAEIQAKVQTESRAPIPGQTPVSKPADTPVAKPVPKPVEKPVPKPVEKPVPKPVEKPVSKPAETPVAKPVPKPVAKPIPKPVAKPVPKLDAKPVPNPPAQQLTPISRKLELWTEKHTPKKLHEFAGNRGLMDKVIHWLKSWSPASTYKALLISGPPGIGKTTTVRLIAHQLGYFAQELNASDIRNKESVESRLKDASGNRGISSFTKCAKAMVIMDEIDGMSGGDKGGIAALIEIVKQTKIPIVCICNERSSPKLKSLVKYCLDLRFQKPSLKEIVARLEQICKSENIKIPSERLDLIVLSSSYDLRQSVNMLQLYNPESWASALASQKDKCVLVNKFQAISNLISLKELKQADKMNLFFVDFDFMPMLMQENYWSTVDSLESMSLAADSIAFSDTIQTAIKSQNEWSLLPVFGQHSTIEPAAYAKVPPNNINFPEQLSKNSVQRKIARLRCEVRDCIATVTHISSEESVSEYADLISSLFISILQTREKDGITDAIDLLETYGLSIDLLRNNCLEISHKSLLSDFKSIPKPVKAALTKSFSTKHKANSSDKATRKASESEDSDSDEAEDHRI